MPKIAIEAKAERTKRAREAGGAPEMEGVRTPSPMTQQVPTRATVSSRCFMKWLRSRNSLMRAARLAVRVGKSSWYVDSSRSSGIWLDAKLILAYRHINE